MAVNLNRNEIIYRIIHQNDAVVSQNQEVLNQNQILLRMLETIPENQPEDASSLIQEDSLSEISMRGVNISEPESSADIVSQSDSDIIQHSQLNDSTVLPNTRRQPRRLPSDFIILDVDKVSYTP